MSIDITISYIFRVFLAVIFLRAFLHKIANYTHFCAQLRAYHLLPTILLPVFAFSLLLLEGYCVITLPVQEWSHPAFLAASLLGLYAVAMSLNLARGRTDLDCGCSGPLAPRQMVSWTLVVRNLALAGMALGSALPVVARSLTILDVSTILFASVATLFLYASVELAAANLQRQKTYYAKQASNTLGKIA